MVADLPPTALYALAASEPEVQERVEAMIEAGEVISAATVKDLLRKLESRFKQIICDKKFV
tara:strand:+ start:7332 stop:7514 length:183 start_codon:yes stop_codon:yes gene_type:complete